MRKQLIAVLSFTACLVGCNQSLEISPEIQEAGVYATIQQPESPVSVKSLNWGDSKLAFTWAEGENVVVFGDGDAAMFRTVTAGAAESKLESKGFKLQDGVSYYACIPAYTMGFNASVSAVPVSFTGQRQLANNNSEHLKYYDYACASATKAEGTNALSFELKNQVSWIVLEHNFASAVENVVSFSISCADADCFAASGSLDVINSTFTAQKMASEIKLALGEEGGTGLSFQAGETFRGFITVAPVDLTGKTLAIKANLADGTVLDLGTIATSGAIVANKPQVIRTSGTKAAVASVGGVEYATVQAAMAAVKDGETVTLVSDVKSDEGLFLAAGNKNFTIDLSGHTFESTANAGSTGTKNQVMHFEKGNTIVIKNGTIAAEAGNKTTKFIIQNYANLTLEDVTIDAANLNYPGQVCYAMSNNCGNVLLKGNTSIINVPKGAVALDACKYASYEKPIVTLSTTGTIGGTIELSGGDLVLGADLNVTEPIVARYEATSTITLKSHKIIAPKTVIYNENATLEVKGSGSIVSETRVGVMVGSNTKTTLTNCKVEGLEGAVATGTATGANIIIKKGTYKATDNAVIAGNGSVRDGEPNVIEITGAKIIGGIKTSGYIACGIYAPWKDIIMVKDVEISITNGVGVLVRGGKVEITRSADTNNKNITARGNISGKVGDDENLIECKTLVVDKDARYSDWENATIVVDAGSYTDDCAKDFLKEGNQLMEQNGRYVVVSNRTPANAEEFNTSMGYSYGTTNVNHNMEVGCVSASSSHTLNLSDGAVISGSGQNSGSAREVIMTNRGLDIKGQGKIVSTIVNDTKDSQSAALRVGGGTVNIYDGVELDGGNGCDGNYAIRIVNGTVNIYGGYFHSAPKTEGNSTEVIYLESGRALSNECSLNIYDGVFESEGNPQYLINCQDDFRSKCHIKIMGGIFVGFNPANNTAEGANTNWVPDGYVSTQITYKGKTAWEVKKK